MSARTGLILLLSVSMLAAAQALRGAPPIHPFALLKPELRRDSEGEPLPAGALARIGSIRLRHADPADAVAFSPDGRWLASFSSAEHRISIWATADGKPRRHLQVKGVARMALAPDGNSLAVLIPTGTFTPEVVVECWDLSSGRRVLRLREEERFVEEAVLAFSPDGGHLYFGRTSLRRIQVASRRVEWRAAVGQPERGSDAETLRGLALTSDGSTLITAEGDATVRLREARTGKERLRVEGVPCARLAVSSDGKRLAVAGETVLEIWDVPPPSRQDAGATPVRRRLPGKGNETILALAFSPDGKTLLALDVDGGACLWDVESGKRGSPQRLSLGQVADVAFDAAQRPLVVSESSSPPGLRLWDIREGKELLSDPNLGTAVACMTFSRDGTMLATGHEDRAVRLWQAATGKLLAQGSLPACPGQLDFTSDHKGLIVGADGRWWKLPLTSPLGIRKVHLTAKPLEPAAQEWPWKGKLHHGRAVPWRERTAHCTLSPDGYLVEYEPAVLRVLQFESGKSLGEISGFRFQAASLAPNRRTVAVLEDSKAVVVHELALEAIPPSSPPGPMADKTSEVPAPPPPPGANGNGNGTELDRWELPARELTPRQPWLRPCHAFVPGGRLLAVGTPHGSILFRDLALKEQVDRLAGYDVAITLLAFAPDGRALASAYRDGTILIWQVPTLTRKPARVEIGVLENQWRLLDAPAASVAWNAHWELVGAEQTLPLLRERLRPARRADLSPLGKAVEELNSPRFAVRDRAMKTLATMGQAAEPALREALKKASSLESQRRLEQLLARLDASRRRQIQELRAVAVLEQIGTDEARTLLQALAAGDLQAPLTIAARSACKRLAQR